MLNSAICARAYRRQLWALAYGLCCHSLFLAAIVSAMIVMYTGMMAAPLVHLETPLAYFWNAILLFQFPLAHSFLLSRPGAKVMKRLAPADLAGDLSTTVFTIVASVQMLVLYLAWSPVGPVLWQATGATKIVFSLLYLAAWLFLACAMANAGLGVQTGALGWTAVFRGRKPCYGDMPQSGLFRYTRHPIYLAFASILWCVPNWTPDQLFLAFTLTSYCLLGPLHKERRLLRRHGDQFVEYRRKVPYFLPLGRRDKSSPGGDVKARA